jgi:hypothetical protein
MKTLSNKFMQHFIFVQINQKIKVIEKIPKEKNFCGKEKFISIANWCFFFKLKNI